MNAFSFRCFLITQLLTKRRFSCKNCQSPGLGLTYSEANPDARILVEKALEDMAKKTAEDQAPEEVQVTAEAEAPEAVEVQQEPEVEAEAPEPETSIEDMIKKAFEEASRSDTTSHSFVAELADSIRTIEERQARIEERLEKSLNEIRDAFPVLSKTMAEYITRAIEGQVEDFAQKSKAERDIEMRQKAKAQPHNSFLPPHAPGMGGVNNDAYLCPNFVWQPG